MYCHHKIVRQNTPSQLLQLFFLLHIVYVSSSVHVYYTICYMAQTNFLSYVLRAWQYGIYEPEGPGL